MVSRGLREILLLTTIVVVSTGALWLTVGMGNVYENFDGPYYAVIARCFYNKECISNVFSFPLPTEYYPAHFPLYPLLMAGLGGLGLLKAGVLINGVATVAAAAAIYHVWEKMKWGNPFWASLVWLFMWPRMWVVRSIGSPESLFMLWTVLSLYMFEKKKYWSSAIVGSLAVLTKSPGILLFGAYGLWFIWEIVKKKMWNWRAWPVLLIPLTLLGLFCFFEVRTGDFWAYFNSGDNIHLQTLPFKIFDSGQAWVGDFWLEDVIWIYLIGGIGVLSAFKKSKVWGWFGLVFYSSILFVSHRDISRYSLPLVPVVLVGLFELWQRREVRVAFLFLLIPLFFYSVNFLTHNTVAISDWGPFL